MGTYYKVKIPVSKIEKASEESIKSLKSKILDLLAEINRQMSTYIEDSEISLFNRSEGADWFPVSKEFLYMVQQSRDLFFKTNGSFNILVGQIVDDWGFGPSKRQKDLPREQYLKEAVKRIRSFKIDIQEQPPALRKLDAAVSVDLSAIAKGYAVDKIADMLQELGYKNYFVEIGGEIRVKGRKGQEPWGIVIHKGNEAPMRAGTTPDGELQHLHLQDQAIATSGDYLNYFEKDGKIYSHIVDPHTGKPIDNSLVSVTVIDQYTWRADAWATTIFVKGLEKSIDMIQKYGLVVYLIYEDGDQVKVWHSPQFESFIMM